MNLILEKHIRPLRGLRLNLSPTQNLVNSLWFHFCTVFFISPLQNLIFRRYLDSSIFYLFGRLALIQTEQVLMIMLYLSIRNHGDGVLHHDFLFSFSRQRARSCMLAGTCQIEYASRFSSVFGTWRSHSPLLSLAKILVSSLRIMSSPSACFHPVEDMEGGGVGVEESNRFEYICDSQ